MMFFRSPDYVNVPVQVKSLGPVSLAASDRIIVLGFGKDSFLLTMNAFFYPTLNF